jgi:hypothetical protein
MNNLFGTNPHKLHRADSPDTSVEAAYAVNTTKLEEMVFNAIKASGDYGVTASVLLTMYPNRPYSSITARFSALEHKGMIYYLGDKRKGISGRNQRVMRVNRREKSRDYSEQGKLI